MNVKIMVGGVIPSNIFTYRRDYGNTSLLQVLGENPQASGSVALCHIHHSSVFVSTVARLIM